MAHPDFREAYEANRAKRPPRFEGADPATRRGARDADAPPPPRSTGLETPRA